MQDQRTETPIAMNAAVTPGTEGYDQLDYKRVPIGANEWRVWARCGLAAMQSLIMPLWVG